MELVLETALIQRRYRNTVQYRGGCVLDLLEGVLRGVALQESSHTRMQKTKEKCPAINGPDPLFSRSLVINRLTRSQARWQQILR
jgi:hypothetical protein